MWNRLRNLFRKPNQNEVRIPIRQRINREYLGKTYYKHLAHIPMKLGSGTGTFKLTISNRAKYLLLNFEYGGPKPPKRPQKTKVGWGKAIPRLIANILYKSQE